MISLFPRELESYTSSVVAHPPADRGRAAHSAVILDRGHRASAHVKMHASHIAAQDWEKEVSPVLNSLSLSFCFYLAQEQQQLRHSKQAESHAAVGRGRLEQQPQDCGDPGHRLQLLLSLIQSLSTLFMKTYKQYITCLSNV